MLDVKFEKIFVKRENLNFSEFSLSPTQGSFFFLQRMKRLRGFIKFCNILLSVDKKVRDDKNVGKSLECERKWLLIPSNVITLM